MRFLPMLLAVAMVGTLPAPGRAQAVEPSPSLDEAQLRADTWRAAGITVGTLALDLLVTSAWTTTACKLCDSNAFDENAREKLMWSDTAAASKASDVIAKGVIPVLVVADAIRATQGWGNAGRDLLVVIEAYSITSLTTDIAKIGFARRRPGQPLTGAGAAAYHSLWSGHTAAAFSLVTAQAMQDTLRGDEAAPWVWVVGLTLASGVGYLRVAADAHWLTDVLAGAAVGTAIGVTVPLLERRLVKGVTIAPAPGGFALRF